MSNVTLVNVSKTYDKGVRAVHDVSLDIRDREFHVLVGPSGCGKSTLLRLIAGLEAPESGHVYMDGICIDAKTPADRNVSMVFQNFSLYPHLTVFKNIAFGLQVRGASAEETEEKVNKIAEQLGLTDVLYRKPRELSGGQRQRVALGRALVREPGIFLLDEPFSNVDAKLRKELRDELVSLRRRIAGTFLYVTHDISEAMVLGDRISVMNDGTILQTARPAVLYDEPSDRFVADFLGKKDYEPGNACSLSENRILGHLNASEICFGMRDRKEHFLDITDRDFRELVFSSDDVVLHEIPDAVRLLVEVRERVERTGYSNVRAVVSETGSELWFREFPGEEREIRGNDVPGYIYVPLKSCEFRTSDGMKLNTADTCFSNDYIENGVKKHIYADSAEVFLPAVKKTLFGKKLVQPKGEGLIPAQAYGAEKLGGTPCKYALHLHLPSIPADVTIVTDKEFSVYEMPEMMVRIHASVLFNAGNDGEDKSKCYI